LIGTMSVYRTDTGAMTVVNDQNGDSMIVEFNIGRVWSKPGEAKK
jgi:hypothetical protein